VSEKAVRRKSGGGSPGKWKWAKDGKAEEGDIGGHVLRETTSRGLRGLVCPSPTGTRKETVSDRGLCFLPKKRRIVNRYRGGGPPSAEL